MTTIGNVLAGRYASAEMVGIWSPEAKIVLERQLWIAVLKAQAELGVDVPSGVVEAYEAVIDQVDLALIAERELITRHDCLLYTSPSPRDQRGSRMPSSA